jgi:DDE superfamily endonuclease
VIPPDHNAEFVAAMEDVPEVYHRPYDPEHPVVCFDETSKQLIKETRAPISPAPGRPATSDYEYERNGTADLFMMFEPLAGQRHVEVTERRTAVDYAHAVRELVDVHYPRARTIVLVQDNLNTHKPASLYEAFPPEEARRIITRLEIHYTPKHGSWLDMAETELSVLSRQCLDRRIPDRPTLTTEVGTWEIDRNEAGCTVNWQFTTADARIKLRRLYPVIEPVNSAVVDH